MLRKRWGDLSIRVRRVLILGAVFEGILKVFALIDLARRPDSEVRGSKAKWAAAVILTNSVGAVPIAYFLYGRRSAPGRATAAGGVGAMSAPIEFGSARPGAPLHDAEQGSRMPTSSAASHPPASTPAEPTPGDNWRHAVQPARAITRNTSLVEADADPEVSTASHQRPLDPPIEFQFKRRPMWRIAGATLAIVAVVGGVFAYLSNRHDARPSALSTSSPSATSHASRIPSDTARAPGSPSVTARTGRGQTTRTARSASQMLQQSVMAAQTAGSAHIQLTAQLGGRTFTAQGDVGPNGGSEEVQSGGDHAEFVIVNSASYLRASVGFLANEMGLPGSTAIKYANEWVSVGQSVDSQIGLTASSVIGLLNIANPSVVARDGSIAILSGVLPPVAQQSGNPAGAPSRLALSTSPPFYPASLSFTDPRGSTYRYDFSDWGEATSIVTPANAVPMP